MKRSDFVALMGAAVVGWSSGARSQSPCGWGGCRRIRVRRRLARWTAGGATNKIRTGHQSQER